MKMEKVKISCFSNVTNLLTMFPPFRFHCLLLMSKNDFPQWYHHPVRANGMSRDKLI